MTSELDEVREALKQFRNELLNCLADIRCQIDALEAAAVEGSSVTGERLKELREGARENSFERFRERYAQRLPFAHELR
jgi:hypothetical protein